MEIIGTIKEVFEPQSGTSQRGNAYTTQTIVISYGDQYPKTLALTLLTKQVETYGPYLRPGQQLKFFFDASSREYNGRFYTECNVWKIESLQAKPQSVQAAPMPAAAPQQYPQQTAQPQRPNYGPQYGAPSPQQFQQPPAGQPFGATADNLPFPRQ